MARNEYWLFLPESVRGQLQAEQSQPRLHRLALEVALLAITELPEADAELEALLHPFRQAVVSTTQAPGTSAIWSPEPLQELTRKRHDEFNRVVASRRQRGAVTAVDYRRAALRYWPAA